MIWFDTSFIKFRKSFIKFNKQLLVSILTGLEPQDYSPGMHGEKSWPNYLRLPHNIKTLMKCLYETSSS